MRPDLDPGRCFHLRAGVTAQEFDACYRAAKRRGLSLACWLRAAALAAAASDAPGGRQDAEYRDPAVREIMAANDREASP